MPSRQYGNVARRASHRCEYCRAPERFFNQEFEVEHIVPRSGAGSNDLENLALACRSCNLRKRSAIGATDPATGELVPLYNPRTESWGQHFQLDLDRLEIEGLTSTGRATVQLLGMNRPVAVNARRLWLARLVEDALRPVSEDGD
jgi:HNH endonuclease